MKQRISLDRGAGPKPLSRRESMTREALQELQDQLEQVLGCQLDDMPIREALQLAERLGATVYWGAIPEGLLQD